MSREGGEFRELFHELTRLGARLEIDGEDLLCHMPHQELPARTAELIRRYKTVLIDHVRRTTRNAAMPRFSFLGETEVCPLSSVQKRIWFHEQLHQRSTFYVVPIALHMQGPLDVQLLSAAWDKLSARHPALRTKVAVAGEAPAQRISRNQISRLFIRDWVGKTDGIELGELAEFLVNEIPQMKVDSACALAFAALYALSSTETVLLIVLHHLVADGWSMGVLLQDLFAIYEAGKLDTKVAVKPLETAYSDYVRWHEDYLQSAVFQEDLQYWQDALRGAPIAFDPPGVSSPVAKDNAAADSAAFGRTRHVCEARLHEMMMSWATANAGTLHSVMLAGWYALLHLWADRSELIVGTVVAGRPHSDFDGVIGCFMNTLPLRVDVDSESSFRSLHADVRDRLFEAYEHQHCPIDQIVAAVRPQRAKDANPLFNVGFLLQNFPVPDGSETELEVKVIALSRDGGTLDLRLIAGMLNGEFVLILESSAAWLDQGTSHQLIASYLQLLERLIRLPAQALVDLRLGMEWGALETRRRAVIASTFTAEPLTEAFEFWRCALDLPYSLRFAPYNQVIQGMLDPHSLMRRHSDHNCVFLRLDDWLHEDGNLCPSALAEKAELFVQACLEYHSKSYVHMTIWLCPSSCKLLSTSEAGAALVKTEEYLRDHLDQLSRVHLRTTGSYADKYDFTGGDDEYLARVGHIPYRKKIYAGLGTVLARELSAWSRPAVKAVVLDADNTLWKGICGEDGVEGIVFDAPALGLQDFFSRMRIQGVAICLCSKNTEADVKAVFDSRKENLLSWGDFSAHRVNWRRKSENIRDIAAELNIGLDSVIFVDDNPAECAEVEGGCPEVLCFALPEDRGEILAFLRGIWEFDVVQASLEASLRLDTYRLNVARADLRRRSIDVHDYLSQLNVRTTVREMMQSEFERASELTRRTSQFNFSGKQRSVREIADFLATEDSFAYVIEVRDRFGAYGLTGVLLCAVRAQVCFIETFLLSCRVLGKNVEVEVLDQLERLMRAAGAEAMVIDLAKTARNQPAEEFAASYFGVPTHVEQRLHTFRKAL